MKLLTLCLLLVLVGCAHFRPVFPSAHFIACHRYGYCSATAGVLKIGSTLCYTDHVDQGIHAIDQKCE